MNKIKEIYENALNVSHDAALQAVYDAGYQDGAGNAMRDRPANWALPEKQLATNPKVAAPDPSIPTQTYSTATSTDRPLLQPKP